jgi:hypothetical protein
MNDIISYTNKYPHDLDNRLDKVEEFEAHLTKIYKGH